MTLRRYADKILRIMAWRCRFVIVVGKNLGFETITWVWVYGFLWNLIVSVAEQEDWD